MNGKYLLIIRKKFPRENNLYGVVFFFLVKFIATIFCLFTKKRKQIKNINANDLILIKSKHYFFLT